MIAAAVKIDLKVLVARSAQSAAPRPPVLLERAIPVFHRWIQERSLDELMVDVADYTHVPDGPGVVLVCHDAIYSLDTGGGELAQALERLSGWLFAGERPRIEIGGGDGARLAASVRRERAAGVGELLARLDVGVAARVS